MQNLLTLSYWLDLSGGSLEKKAQIVFIGFLIVLFIAYLFLFFFKKNKKGIEKKVFGRIGSLIILNFIIGLLLLFFTYEELPLLSARFWFLVWIVEIGLYIYSINDSYKKAKKLQGNRIKEDEYKKYLP